MNYAVDMPSENSSPPASQKQTVDFKVEIKVTDAAEVFVFHGTPFKKKLSWLEFNLDTRDLDFVMNDGDMRNFGVKIPDNYAKHMQNAYQVMMVHMNEETGEPLSGQYFPLIVHRES